MQVKQKEIEIFFNSIITNINECDYASISKTVMKIKDLKKNKEPQSKITEHINKIQNTALQEFLTNKPHEDIIELSKLFQKASSRINTNTSTSKKQKTQNNNNTQINIQTIINDTKHQHIYIEQFTDKHSNKMCLYGIAINNKAKQIHIVYCNDDMNDNIRTINFSAIDYIVNDFHNETSLTFNILKQPLYKYLYHTEINSTYNDNDLMKQGLNMKLLIDDIVLFFKAEVFVQYTIQVHDVLAYDDDYKTITKKINELLSS